MTQTPSSIAPRASYDEAATPTAALRSVLAPAIEQRRLVLAVGLVCAIASAAWSLTRDRTWTSSASFMPEAPRAAGNISSLAAQFGMSLGGDAGQSLQFYTDLLTSREVLLHVAATSYPVTSAAGAHTADLFSLYHVAGETPALRRDALLTRMRTQIHTANSPKTGVVTLSVSAPAPGLSQAIAQRLIEEVSTFNLEKRQSRASAERRFLEGRLTAAQADLRAAQNRLQDFLQSNREVAGSPRLAFDRARLEQRVSALEQQAVTLNAAYEQAKLEEVRDTPVITVVESADLPARPDSRGGLRNTILGGMLGVLFASVLIIAWARYRTPTEAHPAGDVRAVNDSRMPLAR